MQTKRPRGRPRKHPLPETFHTEPIHQPEPELPAEIEVRLGLRPVMTSKGPSDGSHTVVRPGVVIALPRHEAENLVSMGYATHV